MTLPEPRWLDRRWLDFVHGEQLAEHGGQAGCRDENLLESALARPRNKWAYEPGSPLNVLAAAYGYGLVTNRPFLDGNKRAGFMAMYVFLGVNGFEIEAPEVEVVEVMTAVADGSLGETGLADWLDRHVVPTAEI